MLDRILAIDPSTDVVLTTAHYSADSAVEAIQRGASDYLNKPVAIDRLQQRVGNLVSDWKRRSRGQRLDEELLDAYRLNSNTFRTASRMLHSWNSAATHH